jgi:RNase adapter protein RapZ
METRPKVVIVTGLSGSGLSTAIHTLQDNGFYCVDNLPIELLWDTVGLIEAGDIFADAGYAFGMDIRNAHFAEEFPKIKEKLSNRVDLDVLFVRAEHQVLEERFGTARRRHPLWARILSIKEQIAQEDLLLKPVEMAADGILDSTHLQPQQLRRAIEQRYSEQGRRLRTVQLVLISFGFKHAPMWPVEGIHDVRFLPNPYFEPALKAKTGRDKEVQDFIFASKDAVETYQRLSDLYRFSLPRYLAEGRHFVRIAIGCTGGQHRSVAFVERLASELEETPIEGIKVSVVHRELER